MVVMHFITRFLVIDYLIAKTQKLKLDERQKILIFRQTMFRIFNFDPSSLSQGFSLNSVE